MRHLLPGRSRDALESPLGVNRAGLSAWRAARLQARARAGITVADPSTSLRDIFDAILYVNRTGIAWKYLPHDFPPRTTVYYYFSAWAKEGIFEQLGIEPTGLARTREGRKPEPSACVIDSQSVKTSRGRVSPDRQR